MSRLPITDNDWLAAKDTRCSVTPSDFITKVGHNLEMGSYQLGCNRDASIDKIYQTGPTMGACQN